jgi:hypothetical protein
VDIVSQFRALTVSFCLSLDTIDDGSPAPPLHSSSVHIFNGLSFPTVLDRNLYFLIFVCWNRAGRNCDITLAFWKPVACRPPGVHIPCSLSICLYLRYYLMSAVYDLLEDEMKARRMMCI